MASPKNRRRQGIAGVHYCLEDRADCLTVGRRGLCNCGLPPLADEHGNPLELVEIEPSRGDLMLNLAAIAVARRANT